MRTNDDGGLLSSLSNFARPVFSVQINLVFLGKHYKHLEYMKDEASLSCTKTMLRT